MKKIIKNAFFLFLTVLFAHCNSKAQQGHTNLYESTGSSPAKFTAKFKKSAEGFIFVQVKLNGKNEWFLLDSGAPGLIFNAKYFKNANNTAQEVAGASGHAQVKQISIKSFDWNGIKRNDFDAMALELSHLEKRIGVEFKGLIGKRELEGYELLIDYTKEELSLFKKGQSKYHQSIKPTMTIPFELQAHIPVFKVKIGTQTFDFGIDTGAASNLFDQAQFSKLSDKTYTFEKNVPLSGANKEAPQVKMVKMSNTKVDQKSFKNMSYMVSSIAHLNARPQINIAGLLGVPFLSYHQKVSISYIDNKVYFWK